MTAKELFDAMVSTGVTTRENITNFFMLLSVDILQNQIDMTLTPDDFGRVYTTVNNKQIEVTD